MLTPTYAVSFNNRVKFAASPGGGLTVELNGRDGESSSIAINEINISYRLLAEFFNKMADNRKEGTFQEILTGSDRAARVIAANIAKIM